MAITITSPGTAAHANNLSVTPGLYSGHQADDIILNFDVFRQIAVGTVAATGYTSVISESLGSTNGVMTLLAKIHDGTESDPTNTHSSASAASHSAITVGIRGAVLDLSGSPAAFLDGAVAVAANTASGLTVDYPALTVTNNNCIVFIFAYHRNDLEGGTFDTPSGFTKLAEFSTTLGADHTGIIYYQIQTTATNISAGTITKSAGTGDTGKAVTFAIKAAAATTKYVKLLAHSSGASETALEVVVYSAPSGSNYVTGTTRYGSTNGQAFEATLEAGEAVLLVPAADVNCSPLAASTTVAALAQNATYTTGMVAATIVEV